MYSDSISLPLTMSIVHKMDFISNKKGLLLLFLMPVSHYVNKKNMFQILLEYYSNIMQSQDQHVFLN